VIKEFMEDRGAINAAANALAYQRKITGGPVSVANLSGHLGGLQVTPGADQPLVPSSFRRPMPGSIIDSNNSTITGIRADTGAPNADRDAERLLTIAGSGTATPNHYFGGTNNALAGAQSVEVAVIKAFEDFQTFLRNDYKELAEYVISVANDVAPSEIDASEREIAWKFPPIMTQDIVKWVTGFAQWSQQVAPKNRVVREIALRQTAQVLGVPNIEMIWDEIMAEEKRIADMEDAEAEMRQEQQQKSLDAPMVVAGGNGFGGAASGRDSKNGASGQKATTGVNAPGRTPDDIRLTRGRPPREGATGPRSKRQ
jgi:hypothetical protein